MTLFVTDIILKLLYMHTGVNNKYTMDSRATFLNIGEEVTKNLGMIRT